MPTITNMMHALTKSALPLILLASLTGGGCEFSNKKNLLTPTSPSGSGSSSSSGSSGSSSSGSSGGGAVSTPAAAGTWAAPNIAGIPNIGTCTDLQWQISS